MKRNTLFFISLLLLIFLLFISLSQAASYIIQNPSDKQLRLIKIALGEGITIKSSAMIKSSNHKNAFYIGVNFYAPGVKEKMTGIWLIGGTWSNPGMLFSVDGYAHQFSGMRKASETKAAAYPHDPESKYILQFLKSKK